MKSCRKNIIVIIYYLVSSSVEATVKRRRTSTSSLYCAGEEGKRKTSCSRAANPLADTLTHWHTHTGRTDSIVDSVNCRLLRTKGAVGGEVGPFSCRLIAFAASVPLSNTFVLVWVQVLSSGTWGLPFSLQHWRFVCRKGIKLYLLPVCRTPSTPWSRPTIFPSFSPPSSCSTIDGR